jgi:hypothetical protein
MEIVYLGVRTWDALHGCVRFDVLVDGRPRHCAIGTRELQLLCDEYDDALQAFDACRMVVLHCMMEQASGKRDAAGEWLKIDMGTQCAPPRRGPRRVEIPFPLPVSTPLPPTKRRIS